jgi:hypothetical protein
MANFESRWNKVGDVALNLGAINFEAQSPERAMHQKIRVGEE